MGRGNLTRHKVARAAKTHPIRSNPYYNEWKSTFTRSKTRSKKVIFFVQKVIDTGSMRAWAKKRDLVTSR